MQTKVIARSEIPAETRSVIHNARRMVAEVTPAQKRVEAVRKATGVEPLAATFDVVHVGTHGMPDAWFVNKLDLPVRVLQAAGYTATQVVPASLRANDLAPYFAANPPRLALLRGLLYTPEAVRELALQFPITQWVSQMQSSQPYLLRHPLGHAKQAEHIALAKELPNAWYAIADDTPLLRLCGCERAVHVPNVFEAAPDLTRKPRRKPKGRPAVVSIICALRDLKNWPNALIACALAAQTHDLTVLLQWTRPERNDQEPQVRALCELLGLRHEVLPWQAPADYWREIDERVDVCLQPTFTESFCYVPLEHMRHGIPAVGSPAVAYLPKTQQANPDDARDISAKLCDTIDNYRVRSTTALKCYRDTCATQAGAFVASIARIIGQPAGAKTTLQDALHGAEPGEAPIL